MRRTPHLALGGFLVPLFLITLSLSGRFSSAAPRSAEVVYASTGNMEPAGEFNSSNSPVVVHMDDMADQSPPTVFQASLNVSAEQLHGPYSHKNLTVFLVSLSGRDDRDYLTLDEGLRSGLVKITEKEDEQVGQLTIDNRSGQPLYLHEGERLQGGKQDRTIIASQVIPPKSGPMPLAAFCVEQSRWVAGPNGRAFTASSGLALAPKGVRGAAKVEQSQSGVWACVGAQKQTLHLRLSASSSTSSINESFDSPQTQKVSQEYSRALMAALARHPRAVGVLVLVNGQFEEADVYPGPKVFRKLFPRLVQSYAVQAVMLEDQPRKQLPSKAALVSVLESSRYKDTEKSTHVRQIDERNKLGVRSLPKNLFVCVTRYRDDVVHWQILAKNGAQGRRISPPSRELPIVDGFGPARIVDDSASMDSVSRPAAANGSMGRSAGLWASGNRVLRPVQSQPMSRRAMILGSDW